MHLTILEVSVILGGLIALGVVVSWLSYSIGYTQGQRHTEKAINDVRSRLAR